MTHSVPASRPSDLAIVGRRRRGRGRGAGRGGARGVAALDDLVEVAAIEPYAAALRAIIDLDPLTFRHRQIHAAGRAKQALGVGHGYSFLKGRIMNVQRGTRGRRSVKLPAASRRARDRKSVV